MNPWVPETVKILTDLWESNTPDQIAEAVNQWHESEARTKGHLFWPRTTSAGVMYRAAKLGLITIQEAEAFQKNVKKLRARMHYINPKVRLAVLDRDGQQCLLCGATEDLETDHIIPVADGGSSDIENLQTLCHHCHQT